MGYNLEGVGDIECKWNGNVELDVWRDAEWQDQTWAHTRSRRSGEYMKQNDRETMEVVRAC